jgi:hypothetical protein
MNQKAEAIKRTTTIDELYGHLDWLTRETERIISARTAAFGEIRMIADSLRDIRLLLNELDCREAWPGRTGAAGPAVKDLASRYLDLEGKAKELRNDLDTVGKNGDVRRAV